MNSSVTEYSKTGSNPALSWLKFHNNGIGDFITPAIWRSVCDMGPCLDAPDSISAGGCVNGWAVQLYVLRDGG